METKQKILDYCQENGIDLSKMYNDGKIPRIGDFHFKNGSYSETAQNVSEIDGVYVGYGFCVSKYEGDKMYKPEAEKFCQEHSLVLPPYNVRDIMKNSSKRLNIAFSKIKWSPLQEPGFLYWPSYWSEEDEAISENDAISVGGIDPIEIPASSNPLKKRVRGVFCSGPHTKEAIKESCVVFLISQPEQALQRLAKVMGASPQFVVDIFNENFAIPKAGDFLLADGKVKPSENILENDSAIGIFIDINTYVSLNMGKGAICYDVLPTTTLLPKLKDLTTLGTHIDVVNESLSKIQLQDLLFYGDVLKNCWLEIPIEKRFPGEVRRLVEIKTWEQLGESGAKILKLAEMLMKKN